MNIQQPTITNGIYEITATVNMMEETRFSPAEGNIISNTVQENAWSPFSRFSHPTEGSILRSGDSHT